MHEKKPRWNWPPDSRTHRILFFVVLIIILLITLKLLGGADKWADRPAQVQFLAA